MESLNTYIKYEEQFIMSLLFNFPKHIKWVKTIHLSLPIWNFADQCHSLGRLFWPVRYENAYKLLLPLLPIGQSTNQPAIIGGAEESRRGGMACFQHKFPLDCSKLHVAWKFRRSHRKYLSPAANNSQRLRSHFDIWPGNGEMGWGFLQLGSLGSAMHSLHSGLLGIL